MSDLKDEEYEGHERRKHARLTPQDLEAIKEQILASVYEDIGRSIVKRFLWLAGAALVALFGWLVSTGKIQIGR